MNLSFKSLERQFNSEGKGKVSSEKKGATCDSTSQIREEFLVGIDWNERQKIPLVSLLGKLASAKGGKNQNSISIRKASC